MTTLLWIIGAFIVFVVLSGALVHDREKARKERELMDGLTKRNRERVDKPGWIKQPWQHDPQRPSSSATVRDKD